MPTEKPRFTITVDDELYRQITEYRFSNRMKNQTQAVLNLIDKGLQVISASNTTNSLAIHEKNNVKKYRTLDEYGKKAVDAVLNIEFERCEHATECQDTKSQQKNCAAARDGQRVQINPVENLEDLLSEDTYDK